MDKYDLSKVKKVGLLAGAGYLPKHVYDACCERGIECEVIIFEGQTSTELFPKNSERETFRLHHISKILKRLKSKGIEHIVLAGRVQRTPVSKLLLDLKGAKLLTKILKSGLNDNAILTAILNFLEREGFKIIPPEVFTPHILMSKGPLSDSHPDKAALADIKKGLNILSGIAYYDIGQGLIIQEGLVLGVEAAEGTDELIKRCGEIRQIGDAAPILIKISKPNQDKRIDLPSIGPDTIKNLHHYGLRGIAAEANNSIIIEKEKCIQLANKLGVFIYGI